jgi:hypothetical protein
MEGYTTAGLLNQEDNFKIISKTLLVIVSIIKKNNAISADIIKTIIVVVIVSFLVGHTIFETSFLTCCTYLNGLIITSSKIKFLNS